MFGSKRKKILMNGVQARAVITRIEDTNVTVNGNPRVKLTLQVQPVGDVAFETTKKMTVSRLAIPTIGSSMWVRYDPQDRSRVEIDEAANDELSAAATAGPAPMQPAGGLPASGMTFSTTVEGTGAVIDARGVPGLREELMKAVQDVQAGGNPAELQQAVIKAMSQGHAIGVPEGGMPGMMGAAGPGPAEDPLDRLEKLNELRKSGALTEAEFEAQKAKILGST
jgi:hypothetical protein